MDYASKLKSLTTDIETAFDVAVREAAKPFSEKFNALITDYIDNLNGRYKRHCFIFTDSMGDKAIECYHRVTCERLCWWSGEGDIFYDVAETIVLRSPFRDFHQYDLDTEIKEFMYFMAEYQSTMTGKYYFNWDGKAQFNDDDRMKAGN